MRRLECGGPIVGLFESATYEEETVTLTPGDWLIVFSDGVSEAMSATGEEFGESAHPRRASQSNTALEPQQLLEALFADVRDFAHGAAQSDDITAMVLRYGRMTALGRRRAARRLASGSSLAIVVWNGLYDCWLARGVEDYLLQARAARRRARPRRRDVDAMRATVQRRRGRRVALGVRHPASPGVRPATGSRLIATVRTA